MKLPDLGELAVRNLRESVLRNSLTTIGISVGVASLVAMLSLGIGLQQLASRRLMNSGLFDTVVVTSRRDLRNFGREDDRSAPPPGESRILDEPTRLEIEHLPNVMEAYPDIRFITELRFDDKPHLTMVAALPSSAKSNDAFEALQGHFFSADTAPEVVIQKTFAEELLGKTPKSGLDETNVAQLAPPLLGKELVMRYAQREASQAAPSAGNDTASGDQGISGAAYSVVSRELKLKIVGVADLDPESMRGPTRARVFLPLKLAESMHVMQPTDLREISRSAGSQPVYSSVSVRVKNPAQIRAIEDAIKKMGFNTFSILDATRSLQQFFAVLDVFLGIFGSLALAVASIGIVNTLVMAILERRREIGIMKAIGASDGDVKKLFFAEAGAMGILGGIVGVALGWAIGQVINLGTNIYLKRQSLPPEHFWSVPWWLVAFALVFAFGVSLVSGLYPAGRAARLDPVQALRYE
ncbi:MAG TPA: FtsX-like permease family protein [Candidatus Sulfotelmatobacter sp.]|jgi:putative ABC transport system permease protein|nr:FtsX-like permease family protein [Candidatus Sulfotelmatobacter sp.]